MMESSEKKLAMMMRNQAKRVPEQYTKRSRRKQQTQESKYGGRNQAMANREGRVIRGTDCFNQGA